MATKILIPTPLRPYTDKKDAVDADGATVGELLADLVVRHAGLKAHLYNDQGKLRSFVNIYVNDDDIRYLAKEQTPVKAGDTVSIIPSVAGGVETTIDTRGPASTGRHRRDARAAAADQRRGQTIQPAPDHAGDRRRGSAKAQGGQGSLHRRWRSRVAGRHVSRGRGRRDDRHRRLRRGRFQQPPAADHSLHARRRTHQAGLREGSPQRHQPARRRADLRHRAVVGECAEVVRAVRRHSRRHRQFSHALSDQRRVRPARQAERLRQHLPLRGSGIRFCHQGRSLLPVPLPGAAPSRSRTELRGGRRAGRAARRHRRHSGHRGAQIDCRDRRAADRSFPDLRRAPDAVPRAEAAEGSGLPGLRYASDGHQAD